MDDLADAVDKWLYCHWDSHKQDVQFGNEAELDKHLYSHYTFHDENLIPEAASAPKQTVECHWDACHETLDVDNIMEHFYRSHQVESLHPHVGSCEHELPPCPPPHDEVETPYVRLNSSMDEISEPKLDPSSLPTLEKVEPEYNTYQCLWNHGSGICGLVFPTSSELNAHIIHNHTGQPPHICEWDQCNRQKSPFYQRQKLVRHLQTHAKCLEFKCHHCPKAFESSTKLKEHLATHEKEKPFECNLCHKRFKARNSYNIHLRTHTGAKPLVCPFPGCGKHFSESSNLAKHRRTHMAPQFACSICGRKFTRKDHLNRHMKSQAHSEILKTSVDIENKLTANQQLLPPQNI